MVSLHGLQWTVGCHPFVTVMTSIKLQLSNFCSQVHTSCRPDTLINHDETPNKTSGCTEGKSSINGLFGPQITGWFEWKRNTFKNLFFSFKRLYGRLTDARGKVARLHGHFN